MVGLEVIIESEHSLGAMPPLGVFRAEHFGARQPQSFLVYKKANILMFFIPRLSGHGWDVVFSGRFPVIIENGYGQIHLAVVDVVAAIGQEFTPLPLNDAAIELGGVGLP